MANEENLKPFKKGHDKRRQGNGRPPKLVHQLNEELKAEATTQRVQRYYPIC